MNDQAKTNQVINTEPAADSTEPAKSNRLIMIMIIITIVLILIYALCILLFFFLGNQPPYHQITISNQTGQNLTLLLAFERQPKGYLRQPLAAGSSTVYAVTPAVYLTVAAYDSSGPEFLGTQALIQLAGDKYQGATQVKHNNQITAVPRDENEASQDQYNVALNAGYNFPIEIQPDQGCTGPIWNHQIMATGPTGSLMVCPTPLQMTNQQTYWGCLSACAKEIETPIYCCTKTGLCSQTGGCQAAWLDNDFYSVFAYACPSCAITNCQIKDLAYHCQPSSSALTNYHLIFKPA